MEADKDMILLPPASAPAKRGRGRPPKHGAYSKFALATLEDEKVAEIEAIMRGEKMLVTAIDMPFVVILGRIMAQMELLDRWFHANGYLQSDGKGSPWPVVPHYLNLAKQAARMLDQLGLTPTARYRLGRELAQTEDIASKILLARQT